MYLTGQSSWKAVIALLKGFNKIIDGIAVFIGVLITLCVVMITVEIVLRSLFYKTLFITDEYCGYIMAIITFWSLFYSEINNDHIQITILDSYSTKILPLIKKMRFICGLVFSVYLLHVFGRLVMESWEYNSVSLQVSETPLVIPQSLLIPGLFILVLIYLWEIKER